jgi:hypothetical protein
VADLILIEQLQDYLIAQGVGQAQDQAVSTSVPTIWLQPRDGYPQPREGETATISLVDTLLSSPPGEAWFEETFVDIVIRSRSAPTGKLLHRTIRGLLAPIDQPWGRMMWTMGALLVEYSTGWRGEQPLAIASRNPQVNNNLVTHDRVASYRFGCRRKSLAGLPYVP